MFPAESLLSTLLLVLSVTANPVVIRNSPISLPFTTRINATIATKGLVQADQARVAFLRAQARAKAAGTLASDAVVGFPVTNQAVEYTTSIGVGLPATNYTVIIDTGSSNTWITGPIVGDGGVDTGEPVAVTYGSGSFLGTEYIETVTLAPGLVITDQSIGVAASSEGFEGVDGILGLGPTILTEGTLTDEEDTEIPTVTDNLYSQGTITADEVAISFEPTTTESISNGELTFGGTDSTKYTGAIAYTPITTTEPASYYWGINEEITYGSTTGTTILAETAGIVDTGTTLILIASDAYSEYETATGATYDDVTGLLRLTTAQYDNLESLYFTTNGVSYELTANAQIWPRALNTYIGGTSEYVYLIVNDIGTPSGEGLDFINGYTFLERFYSVFDTGNNQVGFATTSYTDATTN